MNSTPPKRLSVPFFLTSFGLSFAVNAKVAANEYFPGLIIAWLSSILLFLVPFLPRPEIFPRPWPKISFKNLGVFFLIALPVMTRLANLDEGRIMQDGLITAYYSSVYDLRSVNFFSAIPTDKTWVSQFPTPFFFLQKIFFLVFGESVLSVKLSTLPYVFLVSLMTFFIVKMLISEKAALISVVFYAFFPFSLYLETLGLHFVSSTAVFAVFFFFLITYAAAPRLLPAALTGVFAAASYLFYLSSYLALPLLVLAFIFKFLTQPRVSILKGFLVSIAAFSLVISPFLTYGFHFNQYFTQRFEQTSLLEKAKEKTEKGETRWQILKENTILTFKSFYQDKIGGTGGYDFGHLALFNRFSQALVVVALFFGLRLIFGRLAGFLTALVILASFLAVALSGPSVSYHRFSLAFPFVSILMAYPLDRALNFAKKFPSPTRPLISLTILIVLLGYAVSGQRYFQRAVERDVTANHADLDHLKVINYIKRYLPERKIYVAAFPNFALEKVYRFYERGQAVKADYHDNLLAHFKTDEKYVYVIIFPHEFNNKFQAADPQGRIVNFSRTYSLFFN